MENIKKYEKSKKSAISLLIFLVVFVVAAQLLIFVLHEYLEKEITTYEEKIKNVRSKIDIQHMIKYRVVSYQNQIRSMPLSDSIDDLSSKRLQSLLYLQEIENCIDVLKNGGAVIRNFDTEEYKEKSKVIEYQKSYTDESKYDFLGFTVRVNVLKEMLQDLFDLIIASKFYNEKVDTVEDKMEKIKNLYQNIHPILNKMIKETDRMYSDGEVELENLLKNIANHKVIYERVLFVISALNMFLTLLMGYLISRNIYKIIESRDRTLHLLEMNKEQLESIVKDRTAELSKINEALNEEIKRREDFEKALQKSNFELEQRVKERTLHLEEEVLNRQIAEIELRKFRLVVEQSPTSIVITDSNGIIEYVNPAFEKISGYSISEVIGKKPSMLNSGKNPREKYDNMWKTISGGNPWRGEFINRSKSGELYIEHVVIAPIKNSDGLITNYIGIKEDITDLIKTREAAEKANRAKSDFLANISHEIRTPMNGVIGFIDLLKSTDLNERQRNFVDTISRSSHHLLSIINDILDYSKIESGKITLDLEYEEIRPKIESIIELFSAKGMEKGIEILYYYDLSIPAKIKCDILRINQVLSNLIGNAIKFTPEGGKIFVKILKKDINQDIVRLHFSVRDTGIGIPKEKQSQIFEAFSQAESSTTKKYGGTG
ncbi:MAG: PAS domain S-box protein, partial [Calditerrivibrio sp.]|nr:PAS domain S-box protein [Calditerrivibrio sp.]